ncbi:MAG: selenium metabolism-associated LysR family transcriptional regulator [Synergistes sp.]|nr:selenium metabolism-associated LysR family transcriptional regulator [Synergistes sp.]
MEIRQLKTLIAVVDTGTFTKAADKLFLSQPTISSHIRSLESELKSQLFVRNTKNIEITQRGMDLYETAKHIVMLEEQLSQKWQTTGFEVIHLCASTIPSGYILPRIVRQFRRKHKDARFVIEHKDSSQIIEAIEKGLYDIGFVGMSAKNESIRFTPWCEDTLVLITPKDKRFEKFADNGTIPTDELKKLYFVMREAGSASGKAAQRVLNTLNINEDELKVVARLNDLESIKNFVASGIGVSIISNRAVANPRCDDRLLKFNLSDNNKRRFYIATRKNKALTSACKEFINFAQNFCGIETEE